MINYSWRAAGKSQRNVVDKEEFLFLICQIRKSTIRIQTLHEWEGLALAIKRIFNLEGIDVESKQAAINCWQVAVKGTGHR